MADPQASEPKLAPLILIADDVASARLLYTTVLTGEGYRVVEARDGIEALDRVRSDAPHLAILDISMPRMDGMQVLGALRRSGNKTPVLVITAHKDRETVLAAAQKGVVSYLTKPINIVEFRKRVGRILEEQGVLKPGEKPEPPLTTGPRLPTPLPATFDPDTMRWLESAPSSGWSLVRLDEFLQVGEDLGATVASLAKAADAAVPHEPTRADRLAQLPVPLALAKLQAAFERGDEAVRQAVVDLLPPSASEDQKLRHLARWGQDPSLRVRGRVVSALLAFKSPAGLRGLLPMLRDRDAAVQKQVLEAVDAYGWLKALSPLLEDYAASAWDLPEPALERLRALPSAHVFDRLRGILRDGDETLRGAVVRLSTKLAISEGRRLLENALGDNEPSVRAVAAAELCRIQDRRSALLLLDLVTDPDPKVVQALTQNVVNAPLKLETRRVILKALTLPQDVRPLFPEFLARLEESESGLAGLLEEQLRGGDADREGLVRLGRALGSKETLPTGPLGPVVAKAFAEHLGSLLMGRA